MSDSALLDAIRFNADGLVCAVVQDAVAGTVLMQAWMNRAAVAATVATRQATFWSRSRQALWVKGETSGNGQRVVDIRLDCDSDCLLLQVEPAGPACHTGARDCYFRRWEDASGQWQDAGPAPPQMLERLAQTIAARRAAPPDSSYTASLFARGRSRILQKLGEEAIEAVLAGAAGDGDQLVSELADLWFHALVALAEQNRDPAAVLAELARRQGLSGLAEKAARTPPR